MSINKDLEKELFEEEFNELGFDEENLRILDKEQAEFILKQISKLEEEEAEINEVCDKEINKVTEKVNNFRDKRLKVILSRKAYYSDALEKYAIGQLDGTDKKSIKLPYGTLQFRTTNKFEYDEDKLMTFLKKNEHKEFIEIKESIKKADLKKKIQVNEDKVTLDDKEIEGITVSKEKKFSIKTS